MKDNKLFGQQYDPEKDLQKKKKQKSLEPSPDPGRPLWKPDSPQQGTLLP